jgi:flagellar export protein FliJ
MAAYLVSRQQLRMIEKLREKALQEFQDEQAMRETKELDDLSIMRARFRDEEEVA